MTGASTTSYNMYAQLVGTQPSNVLGRCSARKKKQSRNVLNTAEPRNTHTHTHTHLYALLDHNDGVGTP